MLLYRPIGLRELELIAGSGWTRFPPRLGHKPIFYPVLSFEYAVQIARDWNTTDEISGFAGFVAEFDIEEPCVAKYERHTVGGSVHQELWIPAIELDQFNKAIHGTIRITARFYGPRFNGEVDQTTGLPRSVGSRLFAN